MTLKTALVIKGDAASATGAVQGLSKAVDAAGASARAAVGPVQQLDAAQKGVAASAQAERAAIGEMAKEAQAASTVAGALATSSQKVVVARSNLAAAEGRALVAANALAEAQRKQAAATDVDADAQARLAAAVTAAEARVTSSAAAIARAQAGVSKAMQDVPDKLDDVSDAARRQQFALRNAGQQAGDFGLSIAAGISPAQAFAQQAGQMGYALSEMGGTAGKVGAFLTGPWGIALTVGAAVLAPMIGKLFEAAEAAKAVEAGSSGLADAQGALGQMFDLTTGKLKKQNTEMAAANELLRLNIRLTAINLRAEAAKEAASSTKVFGAAGSISTSDRIKGAFTDPRLFGTVRGAIDGTETGRQNATNLQNVVRDLQAGRTTNEQVLRASEKLDFTGLKITREEFQAAIRDGVSAVAKRQIAGLADKSLDAGVVATGLRTEKTGSTKKPPSTAARDEFGRDASDRLAGIVSAFDGTPALVDKTNAKVRELDDLIDDLSRKQPPGFKDLIVQAEAAKVVVRDGLIREVGKAFEQPKTIAEKAAFAVGQLDAAIADLRKNQPPGFEKLIADAEIAKGVVREGLQKPYDDFIQQQTEGLEVQRLTLAGRLGEAEALKTIQGLQRTMGPLTDLQKAAVLATTEAVRAQARAMDDLRARNAKYVEAIGSIKGIVEDATQSFARGELGQLIKSPGKLLDVFQTLQGRKIFDKLFGEAFRDLEDQANGTSVVRDASDRMAAAVDKAAASIASLGSAAGGAATSLNTGGGGFAIAQAAQGGVPTSAATLSALLAGYVGPSGPGAGAAMPDLVVTGRRDPIVSAIGKIGTAVTGLFTDPANAKRLGTSIGAVAGKGLEGAATGSFVAGVTKALGVKTSTTGAQIGGAVGSFLPIPGGQIIGSIAGGLLGGLFKSSKYGSSTLSIGDGQASAGPAIGKGTAARETAGALGGSVAEGLNAIAQQLGATLGTANVSIGYRPGHKAGAYRVDTTGAGRVTGVEAFETEAEAIAFAIRDAIKDGAVVASAAVQKALQSSTNVDKALAEAVKVQALEASIGGITGTIGKAFRDFEAVAKERVRLASSYGLDVIAIEKLNGEERTRLADQLATQQVGSLQKLIDEMTSGSLFEGSALDKIGVLNTAITKAKADLDAGVDGAADVLTDLYQKRLAASKDAYGTTGAYAADRAATLDEARAAVASANAKIVAAQGAPKTSDPALATTNQALDENNDQNAEIIAALRTNNDLMGQIVAGGGNAGRGFDFASLATY